MEAPLCPRLDQGLSALLDDLHQRGLLSSTLIVVMGEFGRTPHINRYGGRDHWPQCGSVLLAGCGVPGGAVIGSSDNHGAYPATRPVNIPELAATVYRPMGIKRSNARVIPRDDVPEALMKIPVLIEPVKDPTCRIKRCTLTGSAYSGTAVK